MTKTPLRRAPRAPEPSRVLPAPTPRTAHGTLEFPVRRSWAPAPALPSWSGSAAEAEELLDAGGAGGELGGVEGYDAALVDSGDAHVEEAVPAGGDLHAVAEAREPDRVPHEVDYVDGDLHLVEDVL